MKNLRPRASKLWQHINREQITKKRIKNLNNFKSTKVNFKIALWDPKLNGVRYLKTLLYNLAASLSKESYKKLSNIKNRNIGNPFTITYNNQKICLDYLQAILELEFIEKHFKIKNSDILEIGAGYGRTCHAILANHKVKSYTIVDLENCLELAHSYLKRVLNKPVFSKINFIKVKKFNLLSGLFFDLVINIDSFAEMDKETVKYYLQFIDKHSGFFYVKNPVGKYLDKSLDSHYQGKK